MSDATENRIDTEYKDPAIGTAPMKAAAVGYIGLFALLTAGFYDSATLDGADYCAGVVVEPENINGYDNTDGADSDLNVRFKRLGLFPFEVSATNPPTLPGQPVFAEDNQTLTLQPYHATRTRPYVGRVAFIIGTQCWVDLDPSDAPAKEELGAYRCAPTQTLAAATALVINPYQDLYPVAGSGGAVTLTAAFPDGVKGHPFTLVGTHDTNTVEVTTGLNTKVAGGLSVTLANGGTITFVFDGTDNVETSRSLNV